MVVPKEPTREAVEEEIIVAVAPPESVIVSPVTSNASSKMT